MIVLESRYNVVIEYGNGYDVVQDKTKDCRQRSSTLQIDAKENLHI